MGVLGRNEIKRRAQEIFESGYNEKCVDKAAYNLRLNARNMIIEGNRYNDTNPYDYQKHGGSILLPPRKISVLSTIEKLNVPSNLCVRVGITFSKSRSGLIPLFGPQVDPGYNDYFIAVVYNASNNDIKVANEECLFKAEFHTIKEGTLDNVEKSNAQTVWSIIDEAMTYQDSTQGSINDIKNEMTKITTMIEQTTKQIQDLQQANSKNTGTIEGIESGYKNVVLFGVFLLSASIFGVVLTFLISGTNMLNQTNQAILGSWTWFPKTIVAMIAIFIIGWVVTLGIFIRRTAREIRNSKKGDQN